MKLKSMTHTTCNEDGFEEVVLEFQKRWFDWFTPETKHYIKMQGGQWRHMGTGYAVSPQELAELNYHLSC